MGLRVGSAALVTGAGSGIGRAVALALANKGVSVTVVEFRKAEGEETVQLIKEACAKLPAERRPNEPFATFVQCDVTAPDQLAEAFKVHEATYGKLDLLLNNAGVGIHEKFWTDNSSDGTGTWRKEVAVNVVATIDGTRMGIQMMRRANKPGIIVNMGSAVGLYPSRYAPTYSASKGAVVMFTRSLGSLQSEGIRVNALCPEHVQTGMTKGIPENFLPDGYIPMDSILKGIFQLIDDEDQAGQCLWLTNRRGAEYWEWTPIPEGPPHKDLGGNADEAPKEEEAAGFNPLHHLVSTVGKFLVFLGKTLSRTPTDRS